MKRIARFLLSIVIIGLVMACPSPGGGGGGGVSYPDTPRSTWTVMIHFAVDNNIDYEFERVHGIVSNYLSTLESIEAADVNDKINIVVFLDCYDVDSQTEGWTSSLDDGYYHLTGGAFNADQVVDTGEVNSGSLSETEDFLDWAVANYPADGYMYSIFNHGSGFDDQNTDGTFGAYGIAFDDAEDDCLSHWELGQATAHLKTLIGRNVDLFHAYACLMGGMELAYELRDNADYMLFSEALFPADYWSYEALSTITSAVDGASALDIGTAFCDSAYNYFSTLAVPREFTLSLIYLAQINNLAGALEDFADAAVADINGNGAENWYYLAATTAYTDCPLWYYYIDLGSYLSNVKDSGFIGSSAKAYAKTAKKAAANCVAYMRNYDYPATGISIYHNILYGMITYPVGTYTAILTFGSNSWADYIGLMDSFGPPPLLEDAYEALDDDDFDTTNEIIVDAAAQEHTFHVMGDQDYMLVNLSAGTTYTIETHFASTGVDTVLYLYSPSPAHAQAGYSDDGGSGLYSKIVYSCTISGMYYIRVCEWGADTGDYTIDVREGSFSQTAGITPQFIKK
ncbi:MAG: hypothetical protein JW822_08480 [Spirochaetales bacterium]|nr:hypothetical protein [Spirochaetales bacterium]